MTTSFEKLKQQLAEIRNTFATSPPVDRRSMKKKTNPKKTQSPWMPLTVRNFKIETPAERAHEYEHVDALSGCRICGRGPGFYIHKILPGPRGHNLARLGTRSSENKIYNELKAKREQRHASFTRKVIRRRKE